MLAYEEERFKSILKTAIDLGCFAININSLSQKGTIFKMKIFDENVEVW